MPGADKQLCFVIQGFGEKTDFPTGRKLNLDASYRVIKEGVERAGLRCIRADEIQHSGTIDLPMYEHLMRADLVIADLSTYNVTLDKQGVGELDPALADDVRIASLAEMDAPENMDTLHRLGCLAAERDIRTEDFPARFDLAPA